LPPAPPRHAGQNTITRSSTSGWSEQFFFMVWRLLVVSRCVFMVVTLPALSRKRNHEFV
jgi:hypothetical protein